jgi:hypothetical protein
MTRKICLSGIVLSTLVLWVPLSDAQNPSAGAQQPLPANWASAGTAPAPKEAASGAPVLGGQDVVADTTSLAGAQNLTLGLPPSGHSFLLPSFGIASQAQMNPYNSSQHNSPGVIGSTYLTGRLALSRSSGRSDLSLDYTTGGSFSTDSNQRNFGIQNLHFSEMIHGGRWSTLIGDQLSYTPQSPFGFGGLGSLNNLGVGLGNGVGSNPGFNNNFLPGQSILISGSPQISNAAIGEVDYALSHRASVTFAGSYGLLDFVTNGFQNSRNVTLQGGYNYQLDRMNSISVFYRFNEIAFSGLSQRIEDHSIQVSYARRITGRLSFQIGGGPNVNLYQSPLAGPSAVASWMASSSLSYHYRHLGTGLSYNHSVTGGSGLLVGARTDQLSGNLNHPLNRDWDATISGGYSRNHALQQTTSNANSTSPQAWFATVQVSRHFVRYGSLFIGYSASGQSSLASICTLPACRVSSLSSAVSIGYNWGLRPIVLE